MSETETLHVVENGEVTLDGNILTITVDLSKNLGLSQSGKNTVIATSRGNQPVGLTGAKIGLNIFRK